MAGINFKNEEEVQEYLDNLGIEYRYGCFSEKNPDGEFICFDTDFNICI